jgi:hypothetical protein
VRQRPVPWSGRGSWRPGGARHCTNDLDARGRVCSALPGSMAGGMGAPGAHHNSGRYSRTAPPPPGRRGEHQGSEPLPRPQRPGLHLRVYTHLMPSSETRTRPGGRSVTSEVGCRSPREENQPTIPALHRSSTCRAPRTAEVRREYVHLCGLHPS